MSNTTAEKSKIINENQRHPQDTGSPEVQATLLTSRIKHLTEHFKIHKKDKHSKRGLLALVNRRKKVLKYLKIDNLSSYQSLISKLGLRDSY